MTRSPAKKSFFSQSVDLMNGPIFQSLVIFMLPILVSSLFQQLYNTVDTMIVGNVLGDTALAAIGACGAIYELLVGFGIGIGNGLAIVAARSYGAGDDEQLKQTVAGSIVIGLIASAVITLAGAMGLHPLLELLDTPVEIFEDAYRYIIIIDYGVFIMFAYNLCAGLLRAIGNSFMPLVFLILSSVLNVILDLWFIAVLGMGVAGAGVATVISQGVSVVLCILYVFRSARLLLPEKKHFHVGSRLYWELFSQSISMGLMSSIVSAGSVVLQYGINGLGTLVIAGHTAARKLFAFTDMPLTAMSSACSTFVSQNYGANHPDRVRRGMRDVILYSIVVAAAITVLMSVGAEWMVRLVSGSSEPVVLENGARYLIWNAPFYAVLGVLLASRYALQSMGEKVLPLLSSVIEFLGKIVFVMVFIPRFAYNAVILCEPVIWCFMTAELMTVYLHNPFVFPKKKIKHPRIKNETGSPFPGKPVSFFLCRKRLAYRPSISFEVLQMVAASRPYSRSRSHAGPEQPNLSCTPTRRTGVGSFSLRSEQTASPRPPMTLCSSAVTILPHSLAALRMMSSSRGLMVWMLMTRAWMPSAARVSAALRASLTIRPVATMAMSLPSVSCSPLPISKW